MKILIGVHQFFPKSRAGTEVLSLELARGLRKLGHSVQILTCEEENTGGKEPWLSKDIYDDFQVHRLHFGLIGNENIIAPHLEMSHRIQLVKKLLLSVRPDLVHLNHIMGFSAKIIPEIKGMGIPVVFTPTDYWTVCPKITLFRTYEKKVCEGPGDGTNCVRCYRPVSYGIARWLLKIANTPLRYISRRLQSLYSLSHRLGFMVNCVNASNRVLTETKFLSDILIRHGVLKNLVKVVETGVDVGFLPEPISIPDSFSETIPLKLGFIGTLSEVKGPHLILEALSRLGENGKKVQFEIYGELKENSFCKMLQEKAKSLGQSVIFKGIFPHENMGKTLINIHALIIPSIWYESAPLVLCSALSAGTPVLISRLEGMTELVAENVQGYSFTPGDVQALSLLLEEILKNPKMLSKIYEHSQLRVRTTDQYVKDVEKEYKAILTR